MTKRILILTLLSVSIASSQSRQNIALQRVMQDTTRGNHPLNDQWWTWQDFNPSHDDSALYRIGPAGSSGGTYLAPIDWACNAIDTRGKIVWSGSFIVPQDVQCLLYVRVPVSATLSGVPRFGVGGPPLNCYNCTWAVTQSALDVFFHISKDTLQTWDYIQTYRIEHDTPDDAEVGGWLLLDTRTGYYRSFYSLGLAAGQEVYFRVYIDAFYGAIFAGTPCGYFVAFPPVSQATVEAPFIIWASPCNYTVPDEWVDVARWKNDTLELDAVVKILKGFSMDGPLSAQTVTAKTSVLAGDATDSTSGEMGVYNSEGELWSLIPGNSDRRINMTPDKDGALAVQDDLPELVGWGRVSKIKGKGGVQITQSNDTTYVESSGGGASGSFIVAPGDKPPDSSGTSDFNDEFNLSVVDTTGKWAWRNRGATTYLAAQQGFCVMSDTGAPATSNWRIIEQTITDTVWSIATKISYAPRSGTFNNVGLVLVNTTTGRVLHFGPAADASNTYVQVNKYNSVTSYNSSPYSVAVNKTGLTGYYRLRQDSAGNFYADISQDGVIWSTVWSEAGATFIESSGAVDRIGVGVNANGSSIIAPGVFWFFRYNWTADFDPTAE